MAQRWWGIGATMGSVPIAGLVTAGAATASQWAPSLGRGGMGGKTCLLLYSLIPRYYSMLQLPLVMRFSWFCLEVKGLKRRRKASLFMLSVNFPVGLTAAGEIV